MRPGLKVLFIVLPAAAAAAVLALFWASFTPQAKDVVATVNREPIFKDDLRREIALRSKMDPGFSVTPESEADQLERIIERKLIVQEAMQKGLARDERFVRAMQTVWEQTLIRNFIDHKKSQFSDLLAVTDADVRRYYENLAVRATFRVFRTQDKERFLAVQKQYQAKKDGVVWETVGPVSYEDISSKVLMDAFALEKGQMKAFVDEPNYYLIEMADRSTVEVGPLGELRPEIERRVLLAKERKLFEEWLRDKKQASKIWVRSA